SSFDSDYVPIKSSESSCVFFPSGTAAPEGHCYLNNTVRPVPVTLHDPFLKELLRLRSALRLYIVPARIRTGITIFSVFPASVRDCKGKRFFRFRKIYFRSEERRVGKECRSRE